MRTVDEVTISTYEIKRSKFIAHLVPISQFKGMQEQLRQKHPKARHVVYAVRYLNEFEQIVENSSDDGEPKGSSGKPSLNVLRGEDMVDVAVLIVRYFGGIKLGIGGLVRAYGNAVKQVIANSNDFLYEKMLKYGFYSPYGEIQRVEYVLDKLDIKNMERKFLNDGVEWSIEATAEKIERFKEYYSA
jgi:uncharacterized YigZ family protein